MYLRYFYYLFMILFQLALLSFTLNYLNDLATIKLFMNYWFAIHPGDYPFYKLYFIQPSSFRWYRNRAIMTVMG